VKNCPHFFEADGKGKTSVLTSQFYCLLLFTFATQQITFSSESYRYFQTGCKDKGEQFLHQ